MTKKGSYESQSNEASDSNVQTSEWNLENRANE